MATIKDVAVKAGLSVTTVSRFLNNHPYISEDKKEKRWPPKIKMGGGVQGIAILNDVPIWYELWRNINGFPPDYYEVKNNQTVKYEKAK